MEPFLPARKFRREERRPVVVEFPPGAVELPPLRLRLQLVQVLLLDELKSGGNRILDFEIGLLLGGVHG